MYPRLKDHIKFAYLFFQALGEGEDSVKVEVVKDESNPYLMTVTIDTDAGFDDGIYG